MHAINLCQKQTRTLPAVTARLGVISTLSRLQSGAGLGTENLIKVQCNEVGQMLPAALERALTLAKEQGKVRGEETQQQTWTSHCCTCQSHCSRLLQCVVGSACGTVHVSCVYVLAPAMDALTK